MDTNARQESLEMLLEVLSICAKESLDYILNAPNIGISNEKISEAKLSLAKISQTILQIQAELDALGAQDGSSEN